MTDAYIEGFCKTAEEHGVDPEVLMKEAATDLNTVRRLVSTVLRSKNKPVPLTSLVDANVGKVLFRAGKNLPAMQEAHAIAEGIHPKSLYVHASPHVGVVRTYTAGSGAGVSNRARIGFLSLIRSGLADIKKGRRGFTQDWAAESRGFYRNTPEIRKRVASESRRAMQDPYSPANGELSSYETILRSRPAMSDARVYAITERGTPVNSKGVRDRLSTMYATDVTDINRLVKIRQRHPEFSRLIDPVVARYTNTGYSGRAPGVLYDRLSRERDTYVGALQRRSEKYPDAPDWQVPKRLRTRKILDAYSPL